MRPLAAAIALLVAAVLAGDVRAGRTETSVSVAFMRGEQMTYVSRPGSTLSAAMQALLAGPTNAERANEVTTQVPAGTALRSATVSGSVATVDLGEKFAQGVNAESLNARVAQVVLTATRFPGVKSVKLLVKGGTPLGLFPGLVTRYALTAKSVQRPNVPLPGEPAPEPPLRVTPETLDLQQQLADLGYLAPSGVDGRPGPQTTSAVVAFQKWRGLARDGSVGAATKAALGTATQPTPIRSGTGRRVEVLLDRQLVLVIDGSQVMRVLDVSSGKPGYDTPPGSYAVIRQEARSWSVPYRVWLPWASYFVGGYAFHEYPEVPPFPASHGCVRIPRWDAEWLFGQLKLGTPVVVIARSR